MSKGREYIHCKLIRKATTLFVILLWWKQGYLQACWCKELSLAIMSLRHKTIVHSHNKVWIAWTKNYIKKVFNTKHVMIIVSLHWFQIWLSRMMYHFCCPLHAMSGKISSITSMILNAFNKMFKLYGININQMESMKIVN